MLSQGEDHENACVMRRVHQFLIDVEIFAD
jgi:hypothetical protein